MLPEKNVSDLAILNHHVYEYRKGLRSLVLYTIPRSMQAWTVDKLGREEISYLVQTVSSRKVNIFFGEKDCIDIVSSFGDKMLNEFTPEQDFILGIMLGYSSGAQYGRYLKRLELSFSMQLIDEKISLKSSCSICNKQISDSENITDASNECVIPFIQKNSERDTAGFSLICRN